MRQTQSVGQNDGLLTSYPIKFLLHWHVMVKNSGNCIPDEFIPHPWVHKLCMCKVLRAEETCSVQCLNRDIVQNRFQSAVVHPKTTSAEFTKNNNQQIS